MHGKLGLHKYIRHGVGQPQAHQASSHQHRRGHEDGDSFSNANQRPKNQVSQHCRQFTQSVAEPKAGSSAEWHNNRRQRVKVNANSVQR